MDLLPVTANCIPIGFSSAKVLIFAAQVNLGDIITPSQAQQPRQPVEHQADIITRGTSVAPGISADKSQVDEIIQNLEINQSNQPPKMKCQTQPTSSPKSRAGA